MKGSSLFVMDASWSPWKGKKAACVHEVGSHKPYGSYRLKSLDKDTDGDKIPDAIDTCDGASNKSQKDTDKDGKGDAYDTDDDNDGVLDTKGDCPLVKNASQQTPTRTARAPPARRTTTTTASPTRAGRPSPSYRRPPRVIRRARLAPP